MLHMVKIYKRILTFMLLFVVLLCQNIPSHAQNKGLPVNPLFARKYKMGETYRYSITMSESHGGVWAFTSVAVCELKVVSDSAGVPYDEIRWISKKNFTPKDTTDVTSQALLVKPYRISLDGRGRLDMPKIDVTEMTEPIQDFNTFFVAVSPELGHIDQLKKTGDTMVMEKPITANFANGTNMLKGEDCLNISARLLYDDNGAVQVYTAFMPPVQPCLTYVSADMATPVVTDTLNNFQMVTPAGNNTYNVNYGREYFYITSTIQKATGKILHAEMLNQLNLKVKVNCDNDYKNCQVEVPFAEQRVLAIKLL